MRKTPKMLEIETKIGEPIEVYLGREYVENRRIMLEIGKTFGVSIQTICKWLGKCGIETRDRSEAQLPEGVIKPPKEELERMYIHKGMSTEKIGEMLGVSGATISNWLREYNIKIRELRKLPEGFIKPPKKELERMYIDKRMSTYEIGKVLGVSFASIRVWLREYNIKIRNVSEAQLPEGVIKPPKEELERMYIHKGMSTEKIGEMLGVSGECICRWLRKYNIPIRSNKLMPDSQFINFLKNNESALNLAGTALLINSERSDMESLILQVFPGTFKNRDELNSLLDKNEKEIYSLVKQGLTNLGTYIGSYTLDDRAIIPILIGEALAKIPFDKLTSPLEERVVRILRNEYSPAFNDNPEETISRLEKTIRQYNGKARDIYQKLYNHYQEVIQLQQELL